MRRNGTAWETAHFMAPSALSLVHRTQLQEMARQALAAGLAFFGLQALFGGAAKVGQIPAAWGVASPLLLLVAFGLMRLRGLRT